MDDSMDELANVISIYEIINHLTDSCDYGIWGIPLFMGRDIAMIRGMF